jgi:hypothetical protein
MTKSALLRALLRRPGLVPMVSFAVSAAPRAVPDVNLLTMIENLEAEVDTFEDYQRAWAAIKS